MFEVGWTEMLVIAIVMIVVVGPKDLPNMLRTFGRTVAKLRSMAGDFQKQFNDALKEAELEDVKKSVDALRGLNPAAEIKKQLNPFEQAAADVRSGLDNAMKPKPAAAPEEKPAQTLKADDAAEAPAPAAVDDKATFPAMTDSSVVAAPEPAKVAKPARRAKTKAMESAAAKPAAGKAAPAKAVAAKAVAAKAEPAKAAPAKKAPAGAKATAGAEKPAAEKAPRAPRKKTAGATK
ncbi:MAG: Sec-independent protein translocase protein TatB [Mesorhizobium sp.]